MSLIAALGSHVPTERDLLAAVVLSLTDENLDELDWENVAALMAEKGCVISGNALQELLIDHILPRLSHEFYPLSDGSGRGASMVAAAPTTPEANAHQPNTNVVIDLTLSDTEDLEGNTKKDDKNDGHDDEIIFIRESIERADKENEGEAEAGEGEKGVPTNLFVMEVVKEA